MGGPCALRRPPSLPLACAQSGAQSVQAEDSRADAISDQGSSVATERSDLLRARHAEPALADPLGPDEAGRECFDKLLMRGREFFVGDCIAMNASTTTKRIEFVGVIRKLFMQDEECMFIVRWLEPVGGRKLAVRKAFAPQDFEEGEEELLPQPVECISRRLFARPVYDEQIKGRKLQYRPASPSKLKGRVKRKRDAEGAPLQAPTQPKKRAGDAANALESPSAAPTAPAAAVAAPAVPATARAVSATPSAAASAPSATPATHATAPVPGVQEEVDGVYVDGYFIQELPMQSE